MKLERSDHVGLPQIFEFLQELLCLESLRLLGSFSDPLYFMML